MYLNSVCASRNFKQSKDKWVPKWVLPTIEEFYAIRRRQIIVSSLNFPPLFTQIIIIFRHTISLTHKLFSTFRLRFEYRPFLLLFFFPSFLFASGPTIWKRARFECNYGLTTNSRVDRHLRARTQKRQKKIISRWQGTIVFLANSNCSN